MSVTEITGGVAGLKNSTFIEPGVASKRSELFPLMIASTFEALPELSSTAIASTSNLPLKPSVFVSRETDSFPISDDLTRIYPPLSAIK